MSPARTPPHLATLVLLTALSTLSLNMVLPSLASIAAELEADYATVSLAVSGYLAVTAAVQLVAGPLSDRIGRRPVLLGALAIFCAASLGAALAGDVASFLAFRMLQAAMISGYALSLAILRDTAPEREAARLIGYVGMAMALAPMLGPVAGGLLDTAFGWRAGFHAYAALGAGLLVLCWVDLGETRRPAAVPVGLRAGRALLRAPAFWSAALCTAFSTAAFYVFLAGAPLVARAVFEVSTATLGMFLGSITGGFLLGCAISSRLARVWPLARTMLAGRLVACAGLCAGLALLAAGHVSVAGFFGSTIFVGLGNGITMPASNAAAVSVRPELAGTAAGLSGALTVGTGAVLTAATGAVLTETAAAPMLLGVMLAASGAGLAAAIVFARSAPRPVSAPPEQG